MVVKQTSKLNWWLPLAAAAIAGLLVLAGCPDDTSDMAQQISRGGGSQSSGSAGQEVTRRTPPQQSSSQQAAAPAAETPAGAAGAGGEGEAAAAEEEPAEPEYTGPKVNSEIIELKAPYPEHTGKGRYDIKIEISSDELLEQGVWDILFFDEEGNQVASDRQSLKIPLGDTHPRLLKFSGLYCMKMPASVELRLTDLEAAESAADGGGASSGGGNGGGGGGSRGMGMGAGM
jgi:hypothetical protein